MSIQNLPKINVLVAGAVTALSTLGAAAAGYAVAQRKFNEEMELRIQQEVAEVRRYYSEARVANLDEKPSPEELLAEKIVEEEQYAESPEQEPPADKAADVSGDPIVNPIMAETPDMKRASIFSGEGPDDWNWDEEHVKRETNPNVFIITKDEFDENEHEHENETLTAYSDVVADAKDMPIDDVPSVLGDDALTSFGHGSDDRNVVYVRNMKHEVDYEVVNDDRTYAEVVLGFTGDEGPHIKHSRHRSRRRHHMDDDE